MFIYLKQNGDIMSVVKIECLVYDCKSHKIEKIIKEFPNFPEPPPKTTNDAFKTLSKKIEQIEQRINSLEKTLNELLKQKPPTF